MTARMSRWWYPTCVLLLTLASIPARSGRTLTSSLWLDEAWVANSVQAASWREMFFYPTWLQTTPPLFLVIERGVTGIAGNSEVILKLLPLMAGLAALLLLAGTLRLLFSPSVSLIGTSLVISNYWAAKYSQQVKQYGTDFLVTALVAYLLVIYWKRGFPRSVFYPLAVVGTLAFFLSFPAIFLIPSILISILVSAAHLPSSRVRSAIAAFLIVASQAANYLLFIRPNQSADLFASRTSEFLNIHKPWESAGSLFANYAALLVPKSFASDLTHWLAVVVLLVGGFGAVRCLWLATQGSVTGIAIFLAAMLPILGMLAASLLRQYPVAEYPRLILWSLPCLALLVGCGVDPLIALIFKDQPRAETALIACACLMAVLTLDYLVIRYPRPSEQNSDAVAFLHGNMASDDCLYLHGGMWEQFAYYSRRSSWSPRCVYVGASAWPCCALNIQNRASSPGVSDFGVDLIRAADRARGRRLWFLLPSAAPGHWSHGLQASFTSIPSVLQPKGCVENARRLFGQTLVLGFRCP